jgi:cation diffusion facilitator family transporter
MESENRKTILFAFGANLLIAVAKLAGGVATGSSALLAEAAHSIADCLNQVFLLVSLSLGKRRPDETHPFGHGKERFFWALMAAVMIFVGGAIFSIAQGVLVVRGGGGEHDLRAGFVVLAIALVAEGVALGRAVRQMRRQARAAGKPVARYVRDSRDPTVKVVLAEDSAAVAGVLVALAGLSLVEVTHDPIWDGLASIAIGLILALVAYTIGRDAKRLLIGEAASAEDRQAIEGALAGHPAVLAVSELLTMQIGPEDILVAARLELEDTLSTTSLEHAMDELQRDVRGAVSAVQQVFIDPTPATKQPTVAAAAASAT